ncbi:MAG: cysteine hydrolase family protein [bacterium]|jgi:nicotinamidase/pyrazinamidase
MRKRALLVIDMLNDFILAQGNLCVGPAGEEIISGIIAEIEHFRTAGEPVFFICDQHLPNDLEFSMFPPHCVRGTTGAAIISAISPQAGEYIIPKRRYSAFFGTDLELHLREQGVEELVLVGVCTNICVLYTACDARMRNFRVTVPAAKVASFDQEAHNFALEQMKTVLGVEVV